MSSSLLVRRSIAAGIGVGEIPVYTGERDGLVRLWPERTRPLPYDVWLVTHADLRHTARVRVVIDEIVAAFAGTGSSQHRLAISCGVAGPQSPPISPSRRCRRCSPRQVAYERIKTQDIGLLFLRGSGALFLLWVHGLPKVLNYSEQLKVIEDPFHLGAHVTLLLAIFAEVLCPLLIVAGCWCAWRACRSWRCC